MEIVRPWCGQPSDRGRLKNRTEHCSALWHSGMQFAELTTRHASVRCTTTDRTSATRPSLLPSNTQCAARRRRWPEKLTDYHGKETDCIAWRRDHPHRCRLDRLADEGMDAWGTGVNHGGRGTSSPSKFGMGTLTQIAPRLCRSSDFLARDFLH